MENNKNQANPMAIGVLGAVAGAAIGIALSSILSDPQKRKKIEKQMQDIQTWGNKTIRDLKDKSIEAEDRVKEQSMSVADKAERIQKEIDEAAIQAQQQPKLK